MDYIGGFITKNPTAPTSTGSSGMWKLALATQYIKAGAWQTNSDPYFENTTLLLPGNGTNGAQNNTFLDSSTNNFTITRNGNTTQGTFSPFSVDAGAWSNYFDGSGDYLSAPDNAAFDFGSGNFTIECWAFTETFASSYNVLVCQWNTSNAWIFRITSSLIGLYADIGGTQNYTASVTNTVGQWDHFAVTRSGSTLTFWKNGVSAGTATISGTISNSTNQVTVGILGDLNGTTAHKGLISNLRIVKGTAVYTSNFTPPTSPLTAITNTSLLTCQSNRFVDNSSNAFAITSNGDVSVQAFSPFNPTAAWSASTNGGSGYFDGTGDYVNTASDAAFTLGSSGDFTIECWVYPTGTTGNYAAFLTTWADAQSNYNNRWWLGTNSDGIIRWYNDAGSNAIADSVAITLNTWTHVAVVRSGSTITLYKNGVSIGTQTTNQAYTTQGAVQSGYAGTNSSYYAGYISNARVVKGTAVYTSNFTPPTAPLTAITNTSLLLSCTNAGIYDATAKNDLETVGNAQISTTQSKFGGSSMYFDGTGDYLNMPIGQNCNFVTGPFTIECWVYFNSVAAGVSIFSNSNADGNMQNGVSIYCSASGTLRVYGPSVSGTVTTSVSTGVWYHIAVTRSGDTFTLWKDGVSQGTFTDSGSITGVDSARPFTIGRLGALASYDMNGYIDDFRITKGIARYTANFTPPSGSFQLY